MRPVLQLYIGEFKTYMLCALGVSHRHLVEPEGKKCVGTI